MYGGNYLASRSVDFVSLGEVTGGFWLCLVGDCFTDSIPWNYHHVAGETIFLKTG